jgi:hypothetical protein
MTALDATAALLKGVSAVLLDDATLNPLLAGNKIMVRAPSNALTPYLELDIRATDWSTATEDGQDFSITVHVWHQPPSQTPETGTAMALMGHVRRILHCAALALDAPFNLVLCRVQMQRGPYNDPDGSTLHGVVMVRAVVDHA